MTRRKKTPKTAPVTAAVTAAQRKAEKAAYELLLKSPDYTVGTKEQADVALKLASTFGRARGQQEGAIAQRQAQAECPVFCILQAVHKEVHKAQEKHQGMRSPHEGWAVIKEELDELWDEIKNDRGRQASAATEALQVAAMAVRYLHDLHPSHG